MKFYAYVCAASLVAFLTPALITGCGVHYKPEAPQKVHFDCDLTVVRIYPDPSKPGEPISLPINPCGFKA